MADRVMLYDENPFLKELAIPVGWKMEKLSGLADGEAHLVNIKTGDSQIVSQYRHKKVDKRRFVKIYTEMLATTHRLNSAAKRAMEVVQYQVQERGINRDEIWLGLEAKKEFDGWMENNFKEDGHDGKYKAMSDGTYNRGLRGLVDGGVLASKKGRSGTYWINPSVMYCGSGMAIIETIEKVNDEKMANPNLTEDKQLDLL